MHFGVDLLSIPASFTCTAHGEGNVRPFVALRMGAGQAPRSTIPTQWRPAREDVDRISRVQTARRRSTGIPAAHHRAPCERTLHDIAIQILRRSRCNIFRPLLARKQHSAQRQQAVV
jgi:hypothetical protein